MILDRLSARTAVDGREFDRKTPALNKVMQLTTREREAIMKLITPVREAGIIIIKQINEWIKLHIYRQS